MSEKVPINTENIELPVPYVSVDSPSDLKESRINIMFPLMMEARKLESVSYQLSVLEKQEGDIDAYRETPADIVPEVYDLIRQSGFLRTAGLSDAEITMTPFWKESLAKIKDRLSARLEEVKIQIKRYAMGTDARIGYPLQDAVSLKMSLDLLRQVTASEEDYKAILADIIGSHKEGRL